MQEIKSSFKQGSTIAEKFKILRVVGEGSLGDDIYVAQQLDINREVILRILPKSISSDKEMLERFKQEIQLTASLTHPNILPMYEYGEYLGRIFFVTAYEKGIYLNDYLRQRGTLEEVESINIIIPIAEALKYAWAEKKILHRNIKPDTILMARGERPVLEDFGMAKSLSEDSVNLTMAGFTIGNPEYMSPEQVRGELNLDFRSDMYCLGLVFFEIVTGKHPFEDRKTQIAMMEAHLNERPPLVSDLNPFIREPVVDIIAKMLAKNVNDRFNSWDELIIALRGALNFQKGPGTDHIKGHNKQHKEVKKETAPPKEEGWTPAEGFKDKRIVQQQILQKKILIGAGIAAAVIIIIALIIVLSGSSDNTGKPSNGEEAWQTALQYEKDNPTDNEQILRNYQIIKKRFAGTKYELLADTKINKLQKLLSQKSSSPLTKKVKKNIKSDKKLLNDK